MGSDYTSVRLTEEAYEKLRRRKREGESFSETVERLSAERSILDLAGVFTDREIASIRDEREASYDEYAEDREHRWTG